MDQGIVFHKGNPAKPLVIFIHGLGMDAAVWSDPANARILGGKYPLRILVPDMELKNSLDDLRALDFPTLTWSQKRPAGDAMVAFGELQEIAAAHASGPVVLIGHSRGGLLARMLVEQCVNNVVGVITIGSPHHGSSIAKWADHLAPFAAALKKLIDAGQKKESASAIQRILGFLGSSGIKEMLPDSAFIRSLSSQPVVGISTVSIGGSDPSLIRLSGKPVMAVLSGILPAGMKPDELRAGMGDGVVTASSSIWPGASAHRNFHAHHVGLLFDPEVRRYVRETVTGLFLPG